MPRGRPGRNWEMDWWRALYENEPEEWKKRTGGPGKSMFDILSGVGNKGSGEDWWSSTGDKGPRNRYEELLESLRERSIADPARQAEHAASGVVGGPYAGFLDKLYMAGGAARSPGTSTAPSRSEVLQRLTSRGSPLAGMIAQTELARGRSHAGMMGSAYGPATSMVGTGYRGLQGFRGQDVQRYLGELDAETRIKIASIMARATAAGQGGGTDWLDMLGNILKMGAQVYMGGGFGGGGGPV